MLIEREFRYFIPCSRAFCANSRTLSAKYDADRKALWAKSRSALWSKYSAKWDALHIKYGIAFRTLFMCDLKKDFSEWSWMVPRVL